MLTVGIDSSNYYRIFVSGGTLVLQQRIAGVKTDVSLPYDGVAHRFLRIRHDGASGQVVWETAPGNGGVPGAWTLRHQAAWNTAAVPVTSLRFELKAGTSDAQPAPGTVVFDTFKAARGTAPPETVLLADDFSAASLNPGTWTIAVQSGSQDAAIPVSQTSGRLAIGPLLQSTAGSHYNGVLSVPTVDLTGAWASVELATPPVATTTAHAMLTLTADSSNHYRTWLEQGLLRFERKVTGTKTAVGASVTFDATTHAFWRIRHDAATDEIVFETAPRVGSVPGTWVDRARTPRTLAIGALRSR